MKKKSCKQLPTKYAGLDSIFAVVNAIAGFTGQADDEIFAKVRASGVAFGNLSDSDESDERIFASLTRQLATAQDNFRLPETYEELMASPVGQRSGTPPSPAAATRPEDKESWAEYSRLLTDGAPGEAGAFFNAAFGAGKSGRELFAQYDQLMRDGKGREAAAFFEANESELFAAAESLGDAPMLTTTQTRSTIPASARALLCEYQALSEMPIAQTLFAEQNESELAAAAETAGNDALDFSAGELESARAAYLQRASALIAKSQSFGGDRARNEFHDANETALSVALLVIEKYGSL